MGSLPKVNMNISFYLIPSVSNTTPRAPQPSSPAQHPMLAWLPSQEELGHIMLFNSLRLHYRAQYFTAFISNTTPSFHQAPSPS